MRLLLRASHFLQSESDGFDSEPTMVGVSTNKFSDVGKFEVDGKFPREQDDDDMIPPKDKVLVPRSHELHLEIKKVFDRVRNNIGTSGVKITSINIRETVNAKQNLHKWPFYTTETADARVFLNFKRRNIPPKIYETLVDITVEELQAIDPTVTPESIVNCKFLFDDFAIIQLQSVNGEVRTESPHLYYSNVDTIDEYCKKSANTKQEYKKLQSQDMYVVYFSLDDCEEKIEGQDMKVPKPEIRTECEGLMDSFVSDTFSTDWEYLLEAESFVFGEFDEYGEDTGVSYWINIPIVGDKIGVTR